MLNSNVTKGYLEVLNPTINIQAKDIKNMRILIDEKRKTYIENIERQNIEISKIDRDLFETSWDFEKYPII